MKKNILFMFGILLAMSVPQIYAQDDQPSQSPPPSSPGGSGEPYRPSPGLNATSTGDSNLEVFAPSSTDTDSEIPDFNAPQGKSGSSAPDTYSVQAGDTLWDICHKLLDNPWYWPKLWSLNEYIANPNLISPGDKVTFLQGSATSMPRLDVMKENQEPAQEIEVTKDTSKANVPERYDTLTGNLRTTQIRLKPVAFVSEHEMKTSGYISHSGEPKQELTAGDTVYLKFKKPKEVKVGDRFHVIKVVKTVEDPDSTFGSDLGYLVKRNATVQVLKLYPKTIEGIIVDSEDSVKRDDKIVPYKSLIRTVTPHNAKKDLNGLIVEAENQQYMVSNNDVVYLNLGKKDGLDDGTTLFAVRKGDGLFPGDDDDLPDVIVGKLLVVETGEKVSTAYVTDLKDHLIIGDRVRNKAD